MERVTIIGLCLVLLATAGCKNASSSAAPEEKDAFKPTGNMADLVYNPVRPDGSIDSSYLPILTWEQDVYDFGTIFEGDVVTRQYTFQNTGTAPLLIINATSTCGCTVPEWPKKPIQPDSTSSITVKFNSLNKPGAQSKEVTIFANTFPNTSKITIKGNVNTKN